MDGGYVQCPSTRTSRMTEAGSSPQLSHGSALAWPAFSHWLVDEHSRAMPPPFCWRSSAAHVGVRVCAYVWGEVHSRPGEPARKGAHTEAILCCCFFYHCLLSWAQGLSGASSFSQGINKEHVLFCNNDKNNNN